MKVNLSHIGLSMKIKAAIKEKGGIVYRGLKLIRDIIRNIGVFINCIMLAPFRNHGFCFTMNSKRLKRYKNIHEGERCFIIGNGPSLTVEDLEKLSGEITFASNKIHMLYNQTKWRPTYYGFIDTELAKHNFNNFIKYNSNIFTCDECINIMKLYGYKKDNKVMKIRYKWYSKKIPKGKDGKAHQRYRTDLLNYSYPITATVTSFLFELAIYMGIKEIYFIGVDNNYKTDKKSKDSQHFVKGYVTGKEKKRMDDAILNEHKIFGFESIKEYFNDSYKQMKLFADKNGIKVFNATRGGKLEVFKRIVLEDVNLKDKS